MNTVNTNDGRSLAETEAIQAGQSATIQLPLP